MSNGSELRLFDIRAHEGSQNRAWEELAYQLRPQPGPGHVETRKTRAPDGGVEWYDIYDDGHEEGFQAKFNPSLSEALGGMNESVLAVTQKRPKMTHLTFIVPYDFTDTGTSTRKSDQDRWNDKVARWRADVSGAASMTFAITRAGDITDQLTLSQHAGRRAYWFKGLELTEEWLERRWHDSATVAGERYTPEANSSSAVNDLLDGIGLRPSFLQAVHDHVDLASARCRHDVGMWDPATPAAARLDELDAWCGRFLPFEDSAGDLRLPSEDPDFATLRTVAQGLHGLAWERFDALLSWERRNLNSAIAALDALIDFLASGAVQACTDRVVGLAGPAGQGKTHALLRFTRDLLDEGVPAIIVLGERLSDGNWWRVLSDVLGGVHATSDEFLQALNSLAQAQNRRVLVVVDALNESQAPRRWQSELPSLVDAVREYSNLALVVSFRNDYQRVVLRRGLLRVHHHPGFAGHEHEALRRYCKFFDVAVPATSLLDAAFTNPLFLRMYCEVLAHGGRETVTPTRSTLFARFAQMRLDAVRDHLELAPTSKLPHRALYQVAAMLTDNMGRPIERGQVEPAVDALLPDRRWPHTMFQQMLSDGLLELRPRFGEHDDVVSLPFQAYSEHLIADRVLQTLVAPQPPVRHGEPELTEIRPDLKDLAEFVARNEWLWRAMAVLLPERYSVELVDLLPEVVGERMTIATFDSLVDRHSDAFGSRALDMLRDALDSGDSRAVDVVVSLASRPGHSANADWLHGHLVDMTMSQRDAAWSIATFDFERRSDTYRRLEAWVRTAAAVDVSAEEARPVATVLMWLLTSSNRFLRDNASRLLIRLLSQHLSIAGQLVALGRDIDDAYVRERLITCTYGAVMIGGDKDPQSVEQLCVELTDWFTQDPPVDVLARDSARGVAAWAHSRNLLSEPDVAVFDPPYGAAAPDEPPTADALRLNHGRTDEPFPGSWRATSILSSCLTWMGDFNKYVVKGDVNHFSWYPLSGPAPTAQRDNPRSEVDADWAGRWIANRAIGFGWTADKFGTFEPSIETEGRDAHKAERIGKKYQWIALRELLARLADNFHPSSRSWNTSKAYEGPWPFYGRDFDPSLPLPTVVGDQRVCQIEAPEYSWASLTMPNLHQPPGPDEWAASIDDLPDATSMFVAHDQDDTEWVALYRHATCHRDDSQRTGMSKRDRDLFFLQFPWLVPSGDGRNLYDAIKRVGLNGRWMPDIGRCHNQYLGEFAWSPIEQAEVREIDVPGRLRDLGLTDVRPAAEQWLWEGNVNDCSLDETVETYVPSLELLDDARWVPNSASWEIDGRIVCRSVEDTDGSGQSVLLADRGWLSDRLIALNVDLVVGTLSERHAMPRDDDDHDSRRAFSDITYVALLGAQERLETVGPLATVRRTVEPVEPPGL